MSLQVIELVERSARDKELARFLEPQLRGLLERAGPGQRLRVTSLPETVMDELCRNLDAAAGGKWLARILKEAPAEPWEATSSKLVELRHGVPEPLLVFLPTRVRSAAEDSLDIATFVEVSLRYTTGEVKRVVLERLSPPTRTLIKAVLEFLDREAIEVSDDDQLEFVLTIEANGASQEAVGPALGVLGIFPDGALHEFEATNTRVSRNLKAAAVMARGEQPLQTRLQALGISPGPVQHGLFNFLTARRRDSIRTWMRQLVREPGCRELWFDRWPLEEQAQLEQVRVLVQPLNLEGRSAGGAALKSTPVLDQSAKAKKDRELKIRFKSLPEPAKAAAWTHVRLQLVSVDSGDEVWSANYKKPGGKQAGGSRLLKEEVFADRDEGTYFVRVDALDKDGVVVTEVRPVDAHDVQGRKENESEVFLLVKGSPEGVEPPSDARTVGTAHFTEAWLVAFERRRGEEMPDTHAVSGAWTTGVKSAPRGEARFVFKSDELEGLAVGMPAFLRTLEIATLEEPGHLAGWRARIANVRGPQDIELNRQPQQIPVGDLPELAAFIEARRDIFTAILQHHTGGATLSPADWQMVAGTVETVDLRLHRDLIEAYARSFLRLATTVAGDARWAGLARLLSRLDTTLLRWREGPADAGRAVILGPTHPLRMVWQLDFAIFVEARTKALQAGTEVLAGQQRKRFVDELRWGVLPLNLPPAVVDDLGGFCLEQSPLTPLWALYLPTRDRDAAAVDSAAMRAKVVEALGVADEGDTSMLARPEVVAGRVVEYLDHHPYVEQLRLNVFGPGNGHFIADVLRRVDDVLRARRPRAASSGVRYSVQLFTSSAQMELATDGLEGLLDPERQARADDEFTVGGKGALWAKLTFATHTVDEFAKRPSEFAAHMTLLAEPFEARVLIGSRDEFGRTSWVDGLLVEPETFCPRSRDEGNAGDPVWLRGIRPVALDTKEPDAGSLLEAVQRVMTAAATGKPADGSLGPLVALRLDRQAQALLDRVHEVSDWVITLDRHIGLEVFDGPASAIGDSDGGLNVGGGSSPGYLLDFAPEYAQGERQRILLSTQSSEELVGRLRPLMQQYGFELQPGDELRVLDTLRSLSGRLALGLGTTSNRSSELVGLLFARWLFARHGLASEAIVVPVDAHTGWFDDADSGQRGDLLVLRLVGPRRIHVDVVEVKWRTELTHSARMELARSMREQTQNTLEVLGSLFLPEKNGRPRVDLAFRVKELGSLLRFYAARAARFRCMSDEAFDTWNDLIDDLDQGYELELNDYGIIFEESAKGLTIEEDEPGFRVFRFGRQAAQELFLEAMGRPAERGSERGGGGGEGGVPGSGGMQAEGSAAPGHDFARFHEELTSLVGNTSLGERVGRKAPGRTKPANPVGDKRRTSVASEPLEGAADAAGRDAAPMANAEAHMPKAGAPNDEAHEAGVSEPPLPKLPRAAPEKVHESVPVDLAPDVLLGANTMTPQWGLIGRTGHQKVAIDLNGCNTVSLFGVQGFGKSYTLGAIAEMASTQVANINVLPSPLATVIFHYHKSDSYEPEYVFAREPNAKVAERERLAAEYGAFPHGVEDIVLLVPAARLDERRTEYPGVVVEPIAFGSGELGVEGWKFLMGAVGNDSLYVSQLVQCMRKLRSQLTVANLKKELMAVDLSKSARNLAEQRIQLAEQYIDDSRRLGEILRPGRTVIVDLRDEWIEKDEALGLFVALLHIFAKAKVDGTSFNKLVVFDEAHKYMSESDLIARVVETIREMRHQATSVVIASQDPLSVPRAIIELTSVLVLHRMTSPQWLKHLKSAINALAAVTEAEVAKLAPGEALVWAQRATDIRFTQRPMRVTIRSRFSQHGGGTKTAVSGASIR